MRVLLGVVWALGAAALVGTAQAQPKGDAASKQTADSAVEGAKDPKKATHVVELEVKPGVVRTRVQLRARGRAGLPFLLPMPLDGVVSDLRLRRGAEVRVAALLPEAAAARKFKHGVGLAAKDDVAAWLTWGSPQQHFLLATGVAAAGYSVQYDVWLPARYHHGRYYVTYPTKLPRDDARPLLAVDKAGYVELNGKSLEVGHTQLRPASLPLKRRLRRLGLQDAFFSNNWPRVQDHALISVPAPPIDTIDARYGAVVQRDGTWRVELAMDVAYPLRPLPRKLSVVFVLDASNSMQSDGVAAQLNMVRGFLSHVPDARFDIVVYRRFAESVFGRWVNAADAARQLAVAQARGDFTTGNGSNLERGLARAVKRLNRVAGPSSIVAFSDNALRPRWTTKAGLAPLRRASAHTVVHMVLPGRRRKEPQALRRDEHPLAPLALRHNGVLLSMRGMVGGEKEQLRPLALELVRPTCIDELEVIGMPEGAYGISAEAAREGQSLRAFGEFNGTPSALTIRGKLWAKPFQRVVRVSFAASRQVAAFTFSDSNGEDAAQQLALAKYAGVLSPVTSFLIPSRGPQELIMGGGYARLGRRHRSRARIPRGKMPPKQRPVVGVEGHARVLAAHCKREHRPPRNWHLKLDVHLTLHEIVDVTLHSAEDATSRCIVDGLWGIQLPLGTNVRRQTVRVDLS